VRDSKQKIDLNQIAARGTDVKLGRGGIREIEFIAQALQIAYGGRDRWLRAPHTLISLTRLADRGLIAEGELTALYDAYDFLRKLEHLLQMENGLQTHLVPRDDERRAVFARRMGLQRLRISTWPLIGT
jgi:[glutamine synthetase] adenylyltransferase / [glutamine synthetase]-adenylyl-L-tyrosine phosphorylase